MFYLSSTYSSQNSLLQTIEDLGGSGLKNIELSGGFLHHPDNEKLVLELKDKRELNLLIHNYFPPSREEFVLNLASADKETQTNTFRAISRSVRLAGELKIGLYSVHAGFTASFSPKMNGLYFTLTNKPLEERAKAKLYFYENLNYVIENILGNDVKLAIENLFPFGPSENYSLLCSPEEIFEFLDLYKNHPNIGLLLDLGHLNVSAKMLGFDKISFIRDLFRDYREHIFELHLSENDGSGDYHGLTPKDSWQLKVVIENRHVIEGVPITFEWRNVRLERAMEQYGKLTDAFRLACHVEGQEGAINAEEEVPREITFGPA